MSRRAFTLLELIIAVTMGIAIMTAVVAVLLVAGDEGKRARAHGELVRDASFLAQVLQQDLRQAGLGVPAGAHIMQDCDATGTACAFEYGTVAPARFGARRIIFAGPSAIGLVADLPRPDANWSTFGTLHNRPVGNATDAVVWHTENNGPCAADTAASCNPGVTSTFFPGAAAAEECDGSGGVASITCPWSLRRVVGGDRLQIVDGGGNWSHTAAVSPLARVTRSLPTPPGGSIFALQVTPSFDLQPITADASGADRTWGNATAVSFNDGPGGVPGTGWVTTLDRAFFQLSGTTITRIQCFGDPDPAHASWPVVGAASIPAIAALRLTPATPGGDATTAAHTCIGPEVVARNVTAFGLRYLLDDDADGDVDRTLTSVTTAAELNAIRRIEYTATVQVTPPQMTKPVRYDIEGTVQLQNL